LVILATFALVLEGASSDRLPVMALLEHYALDLPAGILVGLLIGAGMGLLRQRIDTAPVEIAVSVATPYAAALAAVAFGVSAVGAVTAAALVISAVRINTRTGAPISSSETRISAVAFWEQASLMVSSALFLLAGRALPEALVTIETWSPWRLGLATVALLSLVLLVQAVFSYVSTWAQPVAEACGQSSRRRAAAAAVMTWSSARSVIGLVIALAVPTSLTDGATFPERDLILVVAALAIVGSVLLQGFTLRAVVDKAGLGGEQEQTREESEARSAMEAAYASPDQRHANGFDAARQALLQLRKQNRIGDEVMVGMLRETDLKSRAVEEAAAASPIKP
jgi:CPA1 family monovalent cation:H+ antiporter